MGKGEKGEERREGRLWGEDLDEVIEEWNRQIVKNGDPQEMDLEADGEGVEDEDEKRPPGAPLYTPWLWRTGIFAGIFLSFFFIERNKK